jgi:ERCC4-related helicase
MQNLSLIVFDEAHHARKDHPANRIMREFYHRIMAEEGSDAVPHILGLTASPTYGPSEQELDMVESSLHAITATPREHQSELNQYVNHPNLHVVEYSNQNSDTQPLVLSRLSLACESKTLNMRDLASSFDSLGSIQERQKKLLKQVNLPHSGHQKARL